MSAPGHVSASRPTAAGAARPSPATAPAPTGAPAAAPDVARLPGPGRATTPSSRLSTPAGLRRLAAAGLLTCTLTGLGAYASTQAAQRVGGLTPAAASHLVMQASSLTGSTTHRVGEPGQAGERAVTAYRSGAADLSAQLTRAAGAAPRGADRLAQVSAGLQEHAAQVEQAYASAASGRTAVSALARADATATSRVTGPLQAALDDGVLSGSGSGLNTFRGLMWVAGLAALGVLGYGSWWLAARTHRLVNPRLVAAAFLTVGVTAAGSLAGPTSSVWGMYAAPPAAFLAGLGAGLLAWSGAQRRLREYR